MLDPFEVRQDFIVDGRIAGQMVSLRRLEASGVGEVSRLPVSLRIILESVLRNMDHQGIDEAHVGAIAGWQPRAATRGEVPFMVARVIMQDISGIPVLMDVSAMRRAMAQRGFDPANVDPAIPADLVIDHSIQVDRAGSSDALDFNTALEFERNRERYVFLKWAGETFGNLRILPPGAGIIHQVHLEHLARGVMKRDGYWYPDTLLGTDSHTTMVNGLGIVGWGVGGIEGTAALLGEPVPLLLPDVIGVRLDGAPREGVTATDIVLTLTELLRHEKVVGQFLEFYGQGAQRLSVPDRATIANMAPEYGASLAYFTADEKTSAYYLLTGRPAENVALCRAYLEQQGLYGIPARAECDYSREVVLDLRDVEPCIAGPRKPEQRVRLGEAVSAFRISFDRAPAVTGAPGDPARPADGDILIAAITSCTNTSNPPLMIAAGLMARNAVAMGLRVGPKVKTSFAPGSRAVVGYLEQAGLMKPMEMLGFNVVGFGCATCMGSSGPLRPQFEEALARDGTVGVAVLSGNRNFEARIHPSIKANFLMSPALVLAYALAGNIGVDLTTDPIGRGSDGAPVYLKDIWPSAEEVAALVGAAEDPELYRKTYRSFAHVNPLWDAMRVPSGPVYRADPTSTYMREPPFFDLPVEEAGGRVENARALLILGHGVTTDHISPVGRIADDSPAGEYLQRIGVKPADFNTYGARRGNHEIMVRGMFANSRLRNAMTEREGGFTRHHPSGEITSVYDAAMTYRDEGVPTLVFAGVEYGTGSSRDWAAKGLRLLGVRAVIAEGFERIHRSNLVGMGVLPCQLQDGVTLADLQLAGDETFDLLTGAPITPRETARLVIHRPDGRTEQVPLTVRVDTAGEAQYVRQGGILPYLMQWQMMLAGGQGEPLAATQEWRDRKNA